MFTAVGPEDRSDVHDTRRGKDILDPRIRQGAVVAALLQIELCGIDAGRSVNRKNKCDVRAGDAGICPPCLQRQTPREQAAKNRPDPGPETKALCRGGRWRRRGNKGTGWVGC